jgi:two-component system, LuxR family, response regulator FixJ
MKGGKPMVLLVDDDEAIRRSLTLLLAACGFEVRCFESGEDLLTTINEEPACLVLDIELPGMNGFRIVEELNIRGLTFPTLLMTGRPGKAVKALSALAMRDP